MFRFFTPPAPISVGKKSMCTVLQVYYRFLLSSSSLSLNSRLYFLRKLNSFHVEKMLLSLFSKTMLESTMYFALTCWGGNLNSLALDKFNRVIKKCSSLCNPSSPFPSIQVTHCCQCQKKINAILKDKSHPFYNLISFSTRSGKPLTFHCHRERYRNSFLPFPIKLL